MFSSETVTVNTINMMPSPAANLPQGPSAWERFLDSITRFFHKNGPERRTDITTLKSAQRKLNAEITGHPGNNFECIFRIHRDGYFRALDVMEVEGGGLIMQSCWLENGRIAQDFGYFPDLALVEEEYTDIDGNRHIGKRIVRRKNDWEKYSH